MGELLWNDDIHWLQMEINLRRQLEGTGWIAVLSADEWRCCETAQDSDRVEYPLDSIHRYPLDGAASGCQLNPAK